MTAEIWLNILAFFAITAGTGAAIWGIVKGPDTQEIDGKRSLTKTGYTSIAISGFAFLFALISFGIGILLDRQRTEAEAAKTGLERLEQLQRDQLVQLTAIKVAQVENEVQESRVLEDEREIRQRLEGLSEFAETVARDQAFDRKVTGQNQNTLARVEQAIIDANRSTAPVDQIRASASWLAKLERTSPIFGDFCESESQMIRLKPKDIAESISSNARISDQSKDYLSRIFEIKSQYKFIRPESSFKNIGILIVRNYEALGFEIPISYLVISCDQKTIKLSFESEELSFRRDNKSLSVFDLNKLEFEAFLSEGPFASEYVRSYLYEFDLQSKGIKFLISSCQEGNFVRNYRAHGSGFRVDAQLRASLGIFDRRLGARRRTRCLPLNPYA